MRVLFICKRRVDLYGISVGLINSAIFVSNALSHKGITTKVVCVLDNNDIDREVVRFNPDFVIIEALWVVPQKFNELCALHPNVHFIVRVHSKTPFLAMEGIAIEWLKGYQAIIKNFSNLSVASNSFSLYEDLKHALHFDTVFLPNIYVPVTLVEESGPIPAETDIIDIGCFGAIRPLKNHLIQAIAAIEFAEKMKKRLRFHINSNRIEQKADDILKNLIALFAGTHHGLIEHPWMSHHEFLQVVKTMDIGMQVSLSESFNIVAADFVSQGIPIVVSHDVEWASEHCQADPNSTKDIVHKLKAVFGETSDTNLKHLSNHNVNALHAWLTFLNQNV